MAAFGCRVGICLQMKNDLDELVEFVDGAERCDDLRNRRVTWPWAWAADRLSGDGFASLQRRLTGPHPHPDSLRSLARDLLGETKEPAAIAIHTRLQRAQDFLAHATGGDSGAGLLAEVTEILRVAMQPSATRKAAAEATR